MKYCLLIVTVLLAFTSCDTKVEVPLSMEEKMIESKWKLDTAYAEYKLHNMGSMFNLRIHTTANLMGNDTVFYTDEFAGTSFFLQKKIDTFCAGDDLFEFRTGNEGAHLPGEATCSINETAEVGFTWGITDADTKMYIYDAKEFFRAEVNAEIKEFYDDRFSIKYSTYEDKNVKVGDNPSVWVTDTTTYHMEFVKQ